MQAISSISQSSFMTNSGHPSVSQVVVYIRNVCNKFYPALFEHCLFEQLGFNGSENSRCQVACYLQNNMLVLDHTSTSLDAKHGLEKHARPLHPLSHPPYCPLLNITKLDRDSLPPELLSRGVNVGVAILLESSDGHVLLTKRASHMRTFPGVWVPPGGHIEIDETLEKAGLRELYEETGLQFFPECGSTKILGLWESVFPPALGIGMPHRHHLVTYFHHKTIKSSLELEKELKLDPEEVGASIWLPERIVNSIVTGSELALEEQLKFTTVNMEGVHSTEILDSSVLQEKMPPLVGQGERISTGTRYALELWLNEKMKCKVPVKLESHL